MTLGLVNALEPAGADVARVVDQYVDPTEAGAGRGHHRLRPAWFGEVSGHHVGLAALLSDPVRQLVEGSLTATHQREPRCVLGEAQREGLSDAASGAGDQDRGVLQVHELSIENRRMGATGDSPRPCWSTSGMGQSPVPGAKSAGRESLGVTSRQSFVTRERSLLIFLTVSTTTPAARGCLAGAGVATGMSKGRCG